MKPTGIIRRIDDLGRVVIPKAIREKVNIKEGDPLEIYTSWDGVIFKKYCPSTPIPTPIRETLEAFKNAVADTDENDFSCRTEFLQSISELEARLRMEEEK